MANILQKIEKSVNDIQEQVKRVLDVADDTADEINLRIADRMEEGAKIALQRQVKKPLNIVVVAAAVAGGIFIIRKLLK